MSKATAVELSEAVVSLLKQGEFIVPILVERKYRIDLELTETKMPRVTVVPLSLERDRIDRHRFADTWQINIVVQYKTATTDIAEMDRMMLLVQQIGEWLELPANERPGGIARYMSFTNSPIFAGDLLETTNSFASVLTFTYRKA